MSEQAKEKSPDMSVSELLREQIQLLAEWNKSVSKSCNVEFAEQARRNVETIYKVSTYLEQSGSVELDTDKVLEKMYERLSKAERYYKRG